MIKVNASIVLYHTQKEQLLKAVNSVLHASLNGQLYLVDNSSNDDLKELVRLDRRIEYTYNNANLGYGAGHNIALRKSIEENATYHLVLNPDVYFESDVIPNIISYMESNPDVGQVMPKVLYPDGSVQYLCKMLPSPFNLFFRRFIPFKKLKDIHDHHYELRETGYDHEINVPYLSGSFMLFRVEALRAVGLFDERFFMYPEDIDITRRMHKMYRTMYVPQASIVHEHAKESFKSWKMTMIHSVNIIRYFNKWGWFFDKERKIINKKLIQEIKILKNIQNR